jgi:hypothetical protein
MSKGLTTAMPLDDTIIVGNAIRGDGIIAYPKCSGCKTVVSIRALASRDIALKLTGLGYRSSLLQRRNIRTVGTMEALTDSRCLATGKA